MIITAGVFIALLAVIVTALRLTAAIDAARRRLRVLVGGYGDAGLLVEARQRLRKRQQRVETVVDTGATGVQAAHRSLSGLFGGDRNQGAKVYDSIRGVNRSIGRTVSGLFAPRPKKHSETLEEWRRHQQPSPPSNDRRDERSRQPPDR
ncbi:hypothetical protein [Salinisphaera sp. T31B1]|uniref:hypothetical protein n=1 Tax=Salinisphaera sp. T31B1 TaxID=727963 RepID=UPI00333E4A46